MYSGTRPRCSNATAPRSAAIRRPSNARWRPRCWWSGTTPKGAQLSSSSPRSVDRMSTWVRPSRWPTRFGRISTRVSPGSRSTTRSIGRRRRSAGSASCSSSSAARRRPSPDDMTALEGLFPLGAALTLDQLDAEPYGALARLRDREPVSWVPVLGGWVVTRRDLCIEVMRDAAGFTVDDPRFSTAQVVGPSMLSLDGEEHRRHRDPFVRSLLKPEVTDRYGGDIEAEARRLVDSLTPLGRAEVRRDLAGVLAVKVVAAALGLRETEPVVLLGWYDEIVAAVDRVSVGGEIGPAAREAMAALARHVGATIETGDGVLPGATATLTADEVVSNAAVMMFGGIETSEGMTTSLFWHLLTTPGALAAIVRDRTVIANAVEESLRL